VIGDLLRVVCCAVVLNDGLSRRPWEWSRDCLRISLVVYSNLELCVVVDDYDESQSSEG
jgi:hypothetical protein